MVELDLKKIILNFLCQKGSKRWLNNVFWEKSLFWSNAVLISHELNFFFFLIRYFIKITSPIMKTDLEQMEKLLSKRKVIYTLAFELINE